MSTVVRGVVKVGCVVPDSPLPEGAHVEVRVHGPGWLRTRRFKASDGRKTPILLSSDFAEPLANREVHPVNAYTSRFAWPNRRPRFRRSSGPSSRRGTAPALGPSTSSSV